MIARYIRAGDSCSIIGISGMGKSNLFRHLCSSQTRQYYLGSEWRKYFFLHADSHALGELSERAIYDLLLRCLTTECQQQDVEQHILTRLEQLHQQVLPTTDQLIWQRSFVQAVQLVMNSDPARHLVLIFDEFDSIYKTLNPRFFTTLRSVRDEYKYRISYLVLTREELPYINSTLEHEEFYELFSSNLIGLAAYSHDDALLLLTQISERYGHVLPAEVCERLIALTGGHPGLLKAAYMALLNGNTNLPENNDDAANMLLEVKDIHNECVKLWKSITGDEQEALRALTGSSMGGVPDEEINRRLRLKNLTRPQNGKLWLFCHLFAKHVSQQRTSRTPGIKIQAGPIRIDTAGEVWIDGQQAAPLSKKELLLLEYLCMEPGRLRTKDEIVAVVYPDEYRIGATPSDDALNALVKRLRAHLEQFSHGRNYIATIRGKGYRLDIPSNG